MRNKSVPIATRQVKAAQKSWTRRRRRPHELKKMPAYAQHPSYWNRLPGGRYEARFEVDTALPQERLRAI